MIMREEELEIAIKVVIVSCPDVASDWWSVHCCWWTCRLEMEELERAAWFKGIARESTRATTKRQSAWIFSSGWLSEFVANVDCYSWFDLMFCFQHRWRRCQSHALGKWAALFDYWWFNSVPVFRILPDRRNSTQSQKLITAVLKLAC